MQRYTGIFYICPFSSKIGPRRLELHSPTMYHDTRGKCAITPALSVVVAAVLLVVASANEPPAATSLRYYISSSGGSDDNDGRSASSPWRTLWRANQTALPPGTTLLLRRGDIWTDEMLQLSVRGEFGRHVRISAYGDASAMRPLIKRQNKTTDIAMLLDNAGFIEIDELAFSTAKIGIYLRYWQSYGHKSVSICNCTFDEINDPVGSYCRPTCRRSMHWCTEFQSHHVIAGIRPVRASQQRHLWWA